MLCPSCRERVASSTVICPFCDFILDATFLGTGILNVPALRGTAGRADTPTVPLPLDADGQLARDRTLLPVNASMLELQSFLWQSMVRPAEAETDVVGPPKTELSRARLGDVTGVTDALALDRLLGGLRRAVEADAAAARDANELRMAAVLTQTHSIEAALVRRLERAVAMDKLRCEWLRMLGGGRKLGFGEARLLQMLKDGRRPSLAVMGGWLRLRWRVKPPELAQEVQWALDVPEGFEESLYRCGALRNVLAHRPDYEGPRAHSPGPVSQLINIEEGELCVPAPTVLFVTKVAKAVLSRSGSSGRN